MNVVQTNKAAEPGGWYSQAYRVGNLVYTAGITGTDPETQKLVGPDDIEQVQICNMCLRLWFLLKTLMSLLSSTKYIRSIFRITHQPGVQCRLGSLIMEWL